MSFSNYRSDSFTDSLYKKVDELTYKIVAVTRQVTVVQQFLNEQGITLPEGGGGNSVQDYSAEMVVLQQLVNNIPVPDTYTTISLTEFISRALKAYNIITNYQPHLEHLPLLPHAGYETLTWADVINAVKKIPISFLPNTLQNMYDNVIGSGSGSSSGSSSGTDYEGRIEALETVAARVPPTFNTTEWNLLMYEWKRIPKLPLPPMETYTWENLISAGKKVPFDFENTTLQELYDDVSILKSNMPSADLLNVSSWEMVFLAAIKIPNSFNSNTLQQMYTNVNDLMNGGSGSGGSGSSSSTDYSKDIVALQGAVAALQSTIPSTFNSSTWTNARANIENILSRITNLPYLPNLPEETYTWVKLVNAGKKVPESFLVGTLQTMYNDVVEMKDRFTYIPNTNYLNIQIWSDITAKLNNLPLLPNPPNETLTWEDIINAVKEMKDRFTYIPNTNSFNIATWSSLVNAVTELQQTVGNKISQLHAQSFINLESLQIALDEADGNLGTIAERLQQMQ